MLDVKQILENVISNYDFYTLKLLSAFESKRAYFTCPYSITECIHLRQSYACSFHFETTNSNNKTKSKKLPIAFPVMIGSKLDMAFRKHKLVEVYATRLCDIDNILKQERCDEDPANIALSCFLVNGLIKQIPFYLTNDVSNIHVLNDSVVRIYSYTLEDKGQELSFYLENASTTDYRQGDLVLRLTNGLEKNPPTVRDLSHFFKCPYDVTFEATRQLFRYVYRTNFDIDHLSNKITFTPGYIFYRLFVKTLAPSIMTDEWQNVQRLHKKIVSKSITNGDFSHVISKKTVFYKEMQSNNKNLPLGGGGGGGAGGEQLCEIGTNNKVFVEKRTTCYREVNTRNYQLVPYLSQTAYFQISDKAKMKNILAFKDSYVGFLCLLSASESKNAGRQFALARHVRVSTHDESSHIYAFLKHLKPCEPRDSYYYVVINFACIPVSRADFYAVDLLGLKSRFQTIECYRTSAFLFINYKPGMLYKRLDGGGGDLWVTPRDKPFWSSSSNTTVTFDFLTGYMADIVPRFNHTGFPKNVLSLNTIKNAVLSRTDKYSRYFKETISAYNNSIEGLYHEVVLPPADVFSEPWTIVVPRVPTMFTSHLGITQDDCIAKIGDFDSFDIAKTFTLKMKLPNEGNKYFRAATGGEYYPEVSSSSFLGTLVCRRSALEIVPLSTNIVLKRLSDHACQIYFSKPGYRLVETDLFRHATLFLALQKESPCKDGDKLCSLAGQKGVVRCLERGPFGIDREGNTHVPRLLVNPESLIKRQTMSQVLEMREAGSDCPIVVNSHGKRVRGRALIGRAFYFVVHYKSEDHIYLANRCVRDKVTFQPVRGRSRGGGMKLGMQELTNALLGNGIASCYEEKMIFHSDRIITEDEGLAVPKSVFVIKEDMKFFKVTSDVEIAPLVDIVSPPDAVQFLRKGVERIERRRDDEEKSEHRENPALGHES